MAQSLIEVNTAALWSDVSKIEAELNAIRTGAEKLREVTDALDGMWDGPAKQAFMAAVRDDLNRLDSLIKSIEKFTSLTDESRGEYEKCENAVADIVSAIRV